MGLYLAEITRSDRTALDQMAQLLEREGLRPDRNLDYSCGLYDGDGRLLATGSCYGQTLRCLAVSSEHRGEGLMNTLVSHLVERLVGQGCSHLFLCTKSGNAAVFRDLGFFEIVRSEGGVSLMENRRSAFSDYLRALASSRCSGKSAAVVMNANPFTRGHRHLLERACAENDAVHLFLLSEEAGPIPFSVRRRLLLAGIADLSKVVYHESGPYLISAASFPSYFVKDDDAAILAHAGIDLQVFVRIAEVLGISARYVGEEPASHVTMLYNCVMKRALPRYGIVCREIPRLSVGGSVVSASSVRQAIHDGDLASVRPMLCESSLRYWDSPEAAPVIAAIRQMEQPRHY